MSLISKGTENGTLALDRDSDYSGSKRGTFRTLNTKDLEGGSRFHTRQDSILDIHGAIIENPHENSQDESRSISGEDIIKRKHREIKRRRKKKRSKNSSSSKNRVRSRLNTLDSRQKIDSQSSFNSSLEQAVNSGSENS